MKFLLHFESGILNKRVFDIQAESLAEVAESIDNQPLYPRIAGQLAAILESRFEGASVRELRCKQDKNNLLDSAAVI